MYEKKKMKYTVKIIIIIIKERKKQISAPAKGTVKIKHKVLPTLSGDWLVTGN